jgi:haloalkane dehalogenase
MSIIVFAVVITRDDKLVTPQGQGIVTLDVGRYIQGLDIPAEIVWGMKDPILGYLLPVMKRNFPKAPVTKTKAGHFLQEEVPAGIAAALLRVIDQVQKS